MFSCLCNSSVCAQQLKLIATSFALTETSMKTHNALYHTCTCFFKLLISLNKCYIYILLYYIYILLYSTYINPYIYIYGKVFILCLCIPSNITMPVYTYSIYIYIYIFYLLTLKFITIFKVPFTFLVPGGLGCRCSAPQPPSHTETYAAVKLKGKPGNQ